MYDKYEELNKIIEELKLELEHKKERRISNIIAGVCNRSIKIQDKKIEKLKTYIESLENINKHRLLDC